MFVYWLGCLGCLGVVIRSERQNKRLFGIERDRLVYIHMWYNQSQWLVYSESRPIRQFYCRVSNLKWIYHEFFKRFSENSRFRGIWFAFVERAIELCKIFACIWFAVVGLVREISSELALLPNLKLSLFEKLLKLLASLDVLDHKCLRPVRHVQRFLFIYFIYFVAYVQFACYSHVYDTFSTNKVSFCVDFDTSTKKTTGNWRNTRRQCFIALSWLLWFHYSYLETRRSFASLCIKNLKVRPSFKRNQTS